MVMKLPNLAVVVPSNITGFAESRGEQFYMLFNHFTSRIQADEVTDLKANAENIRGELIKIMPGLATKIALNPDNCSSAIYDAVTTLTSEQLDFVLINVHNNDPLWTKAIGPFVKGILRALGFMLIDDMFEVDSKAISQQDETLLNDVLQLTYLVGLTIPESWAKGSRMETYLDTKI